MLFLKKKNIPENPESNHKIYFGLIKKELNELSEEDISQIVDSIKLKKDFSPEILSFKTYTLKQTEDIINMNIALNSLFYDVDWLPKINDILCDITNLFEVFRGMKTGQDEIYYFQTAFDVDIEYVGKVLKSAKTCEYLTAQPDAYSFVCDKSIEKLDELGHRKTLDWINRFKDHINQSVPNKVTFWKNLSDGSFSGSDKIRLFTGMNPERRIFYGLLEEPAQINQRAIGFKPLNNDVNVELCHALLNSVIGTFYTEATGFPKGLGALDNRAENVKKIKILNPKLLSQKEINKILGTVQK